MTIELYDRRKRMLELHYSGVSDHLMLHELANNYGITYSTIRQDWYRRSDWEPLIWRVDASTTDVQQLLFHLQLGRERAVALMRSADNDNAKVGAIKALLDLVQREIELKQSLGILRKVPDQLDITASITERPRIFDMSQYTPDEREAVRRVARIMERRNDTEPDA